MSSETWQPSVSWQLHVDKRLVSPQIFESCPLLADLLMRVMDVFVFWPVFNRLAGIVGDELN